MNQIDPYTYEVETGETVTIEWTAFEVADSGIAMAVDETPLAPDPLHPPTFRFVVTKGLTFDHFAGAKASFQDGASENARFESVVIGSVGGDFKGATIRQTDSPAFRFIVVRFRVVPLAPGDGE